MTKHLKKEMIRSLKLRNNVLKQIIEKSKSLYNKEINVSKNLLRKTKRRCFEELNNKLFLTAKYFRKQSVPFYEKASLKDTIALK